MTKQYIVSGASKGIGKAISHELLDEGYSVIGLARQFNWEHPLLTPISLDMSELTALPEAFEKIKKKVLKLDGLICCAGKGRFGSLEEFSFSQIQELMELNFLSQVYLIKAFLPLLKKKKDGDILIIGSEAGIAGKKYGSIYCASKFALRGFCQALRQECASSNVRITLVNPGMVRSDFFETLHFECSEHPSEHLLPEDIAKTVAHVLCSRKGAVFDEINLSPQKHRVCFKSLT